MSEVPMHLPFSYATKRGNFETSILNFSNRIFENKIIGACSAIFINADYLYYCYHKTPIISIFIFFYLFVLVSQIIINQLKGNK